MKVIYVAGKYSADSEWGMWQNIQHASEVARRLWLEGWAVICPHRNTMFFGSNSDSDWDLWLNGDLEMVSRCDAIYMLDNWKESKGARVELEQAEKFRLEVYYEETDNVTDDNR